MAAAAAVGATARGGQTPSDVPGDPRDAARGAADVYDLPSLRTLATSIADRRIRLVETEPGQPSPYARDLLFGYVGAFMYEGDSPLAERRAAALSVDPALLGELLGTVELRELLDPDVIAQFEREAQRLDPDRRARGLEGVADLLRMLGPLDADEVTARLDPESIADTSAGALLDELITARRAIPVTIAGTSRVAAIEDAGRLRDALGAALPTGIPVAFLEPVADPLGDLVARHARTHGPFTTDGRRHAVRTRRRRRPAHACNASRPQGGSRAGTSCPRQPAAQTPSNGATPRCCAAFGCARSPRSADRSSPSPPRRMPDSCRTGSTSDDRSKAVDGVLTVIEQFAGVPIPASAWESLVLPSRVRDYSPAMLDELTAAERSSGQATEPCRGATAGCRCIRQTSRPSPCRSATPRSRPIPWSRASSSPSTWAVPTSPGS